MATKEEFDTLPICELSRVRRVIEQKRFGVEIEVEGKRLPNEVNGWIVTLDGSLRGEESREYVLEGPNTLVGVVRALRCLNQAYENCKSDVDESIRAGVHVHVNVTNLNLRKLFNFITVYYIFEDLLCEYCGPERCGNHFCLRASDAYAPIYFLGASLKTRTLRHIGTDNIRYAALNLNSLFRHGSLEFRAMRSTRKLEDIELWVRILNDLYEATTNFKGTPRDIVEMFSGDGAENIARVFLPNYYKTVLINNFGYEQSMRNGVRLVQEFVFTYNWKED